MAPKHRPTRWRCLLVGLVATGSLTAPAHALWSASGAGPATATSAALAAPTNLVANCGGLLAATVTLTWSASTSPWTVGYEVRRGTASGTYTSSVATTALTYTTPALGSGTHYFTVRTTTGDWRSPNAPEVSRRIVSILGLGLTCQ